VLREKSWNK